MAERYIGPATERSRLGGWLPRSEQHVALYRVELARKAFGHASTTTRNAEVAALAALIQGDSVLRMDLTRAIQQACEQGFILGYSTIDELMSIVNYMMTYAPPFSESSLIHCPLNAVFDWLMCMPSGYALFRDPALNAQLKRVLNTWCGFLNGPYSREHLTTAASTGWFSPEADKHIGLFQFECRPDEPYWGFVSWNAFFTRPFKTGMRPVAEPDNAKLVVSACEAAPYNIQYDVKLRDTFWIKAQPYSLVDIFTAEHSDLAQVFVGGSVYQAFLSAFNYHRWHAPVSGVVSQAYLVDGSYYSDADSEGEDPGGLNDSQGYISAVAARAVIVIDCDDGDIGKVGCVFVGMAEVSSCVIDALPGQRVRKGDELGYFQYGGSTCCLIFGPNVVHDFVPQLPFEGDTNPIKVNSAIAIAR